MGTTIKVEPAQLTSTAGQIDNAAAEYQKLYNTLYSDVAAMRSGWQGRDNLAFTDQIEGFRDDFDLMKKLMDEYSLFLKRAAEKYAATQQAIVEGASRLIK